MHRDLTEGVTVIDCNYIMPGVAASYLLQAGEFAQADELAFIETNTARAVPILLETLRKKGLHPKDVRYIIVTHIHLDHAGGVSKLLQSCKNAIVICHPRAARHLIDPERLIRSAMAVYGQEKFQRLYGEITPVPENRVQTMDDGDSLAFGARRLRFIHTRGHANHHFCIYDSLSNGVFTGDSFGVAYPALQKGGLFIFPSSTPTDFDPEEALRSVDKILDTGARKVYLTHFGAIRSMDEARTQLCRGLNEFARIMSEATVLDVTQRDDLQEKVESFCLERVRKYMEDELKAVYPDVSEELKHLLQMDIEINAAGISFAALRARRRNETENETS